MDKRAFEVQGHRGARGLKPENTLPSFEAAFDCGVQSIETDVHLSRDGVPVLVHDHFIDPRMYEGVASPGGSTPPSEGPPLISQLTAQETRGYRGRRHLDGQRFPKQEASATPLAVWFCARSGMDPYAIPSLADLLAFAAAYANEPGRLAGKTEQQRECLRRMGFDLELKRVPFYPERMGDRYDVNAVGILESGVVEIIRQYDVLDRTVIRSFDHRCLRALSDLEPGLTTAVLVSGMAPVDPVQLVRAARAKIYGPDYEFLDQTQVIQLHREGIRVLPWTVNEPAPWERLCSWGVDGITTDYPDRLIAWLIRVGRTGTSS